MADCLLVGLGLGTQSNKLCKPVVLLFSLDLLYWTTYNSNCLKFDTIATTNLNLENYHILLVFLLYDLWQSYIKETLKYSIQIFPWLFPENDSKSYSDGKSNFNEGILRRTLIIMSYFTWDDEKSDNFWKVIPTLTTWGFLYGSCKLILFFNKLFILYSLSFVQDFDNTIRVWQLYT